MREIALLDLGRQEYAETWALQKSLVAQRARGEVSDLLLLVEHPHVITLGRKNSNSASLLPQASSNIPVFNVERGGEATYHGPGQLVGYPILKLEDRERDLHRYLRSLEEILIKTLGDFGLAGIRKEGATGVWIDQINPRKIASIGVAVKQWVTYHGFALNVSTELSYFRLISPCGFDGSIMTSMENELQREVSSDQAKESLIPHIESVLQARIVPQRLASIHV
ncbi:lipoyl(octanoyl) transferase LipB [Candidatus Acetothermia bacterium]|nr:lipoyl(octanoyl) transferase LipB [Candidatus Acetothermia bacterium]MBI3643339.1 lipoyl(octanoyl) transferase LipB [Candidatus Acetothermia bacterium]